MRKFLFLAAVLFTATVLYAATLEPLNVKTGLWQITMVSKVNGMGTTTTNYKSCVKKEDLAKYPFTDPKDKCNWTVVSSTGSMMEANGTCMPAGQGTVDFTMSLQATDTENVKGTGQITITGPMNMQGTYSATGKWTGATCPAGMN